MDKPSLETVGDRLRYARHQAGMTQRAVAAASGVKQQMISKLETNKSLETADIVSLAKALGVRPEWLAHNEGPMRDRQANAETLTEAAEIRESTPCYGSTRLAHIKALMDSMPPRERRLAVEYLVDQYGPPDRSTDRDVLVDLVESFAQLAERLAALPEYRERLRRALETSRPTRSSKS
ncbi:MAG TPA: helix-turn-helix transcriptional regulator [Candidatus Competibacteraceae bacterium]|nr:helix-turn-helix transcriptional regulator [Candidatus Competibacteraceae bacterium]